MKLLIAGSAVTFRHFDVHITLPVFYFLLFALLINTPPPPRHPLPEHGRVPLW